MKKALLLIGLLVVFAGVLIATVTFDPDTGLGFVGKGDLQLAFGWNNAQAQSNITPTSLSFVFNSTDTYTAVCTFITGEGTPGEQTHNLDIPRHTSVAGTVAYNARNHKQIDGIYLTGYIPGSTTFEGTVPVVGDPCVGGPGIAQNGTWSSVTLVSTTGGGLTVSYDGGTAVPIWP